MIGDAVAGDRRCVDSQLVDPPADHEPCSIERDRWFAFGHAWIRIDQDPPRFRWSVQKYASPRDPSRKDVLQARCRIEPLIAPNDEELIAVEGYTPQFLRALGGRDWHGGGFKHRSIGHHPNAAEFAPLEPDDKVHTAARRNA